MFHQQSFRVLQGVCTRASHRKCSKTIFTQELETPCHTLIRRNLPTDSRHRTIRCFESKTGRCLVPSLSFACYLSFCSQHMFLLVLRPLFQAVRTILLWRNMRDAVRPFPWLQFHHHNIRPWETVPMDHSLSSSLVVHPSQQSDIGPVGVCFSSFQSVNWMILS